MPALKKMVMILAFCALALPPATAAAKNDKAHGHGKKDDVIIWNDDGGKEKGKGNRGGKHVSPKDVDILRGYVIGQYKRNCPPGLAKKNPPCVPPGQAKKHKVGSILPEGSFLSVPNDVVSLLTPPPPNGKYVRVDKNVYLINQGTRKVLEAIELFSSVE